MQFRGLAIFGDALPIGLQRKATFLHAPDLPSFDSFFLSPNIPIRRPDPAAARQRFGVTFV